MTGFEEKLKSEARICPQCRYVIENPFSERCPRCLTFVPVKDPGCSSCVHRMGCPAASVKKLETES